MRGGRGGDGKHLRLLIMWPAYFAGAHGTATASPCCMRGGRGSSEEQEGEITKGRKLGQGDWTVPVARCAADEGVRWS